MAFLLDHVSPWPKTLKVHSKSSTMTAVQSIQQFSQHLHPMAMLYSRCTKLSALQKVMVWYSSVTSNIVLDRVNR